jgi:hypothetical protein
MQNLGASRRKIENVCLELGRNDGYSQWLPHTPIALRATTSR